MSSAQRLIVAWTAGALASLLTFSLNPPERRGTAAPEPVPLAPARVADEPRGAIKTYLQVHYDAVVYQEGGHTLMGLAYLPGEAPLVEIEVATLRRLLPDTRFFKTQLATAQIEFPHVQALVSFRPGAAGRDDIRTSLSPEFDSPSHKFLWQFLGIAAPTLQARREVALAIARLMADTTYRFGARLCADPQLVAGRAEIWSDKAVCTGATSTSSVTGVARSVASRYRIRSIAGSRSRSRRSDHSEPRRRVETAQRASPRSSGD